MQKTAIVQACQGDAQSWGQSPPAAPSHRNPSIHAGSAPVKAFDVLHCSTSCSTTAQNRKCKKWKTSSYRAARQQLLTAIGLDIAQDSPVWDDSSYRVNKTTSRSKASTPALRGSTYPRRMLQSAPTS